MTYYLDYDEDQPVLYHKVISTCYRLPNQMSGIRKVSHIPYSAFQITERELLNQFTAMVTQSKVAIE